MENRLSEIDDEMNPNASNYERLEELLAEKQNLEAEHSPSWKNGWSYSKTG